MTNEPLSHAQRPPGPFLRRAKLRNFKSIGACCVELRPLTLLVGRNGAGKSNFLDALRFVVDALRTSLDHAIRDRGGIDDVRRRSTGHPRNFSIELQMVLEDARVASYGFEITEIDRIALGPRETLQFWQRVKGSEHPWKFYASSMSDDTLRALGVLVAVTQLSGRKHPVRLVGIEEPETALHPAAAGALMDALREAATRTQVLLTTHSPDLLDQIDVSRDGLLAVLSEEGTTKIAPADPASLEAIREHLYPPGELLRMDQLHPDRTHLEKQLTLDLFSPPVEAA
ncbi:MAG: AAA family ATPase [Acidobacteriota bacterium]|jgi:predicted ATPase